MPDFAVPPALQSFLLLFKKWRERKDVLGSFKTYEESFNDECNSNERMKKYEELVGSRYEAKKLMNEEISEEEKVLEEDIAPEHIHFSSEVHETIALQFAEGLKEDSSPYIDYIEKFNDDQFRVFIKILSCLHGQMPDVAVPPALQSKIQKELPSNALHIFVSGYGGTGKSFLIKGLTSYIQQVFNSPVALMAPTGIAASNINGMTVHRLLHLPVQHGTVPPYAPLSDESLHQTYNLLKDVKLFILDEVSMVSNLMFAYIHRRLCEVFGNPNKVMGGVNMVYMGDLLQLAPVKNGPCFKNLSKQESHLLNSVGSINLWKDVQYDELVKNVRQSTDERFGRILKGIRVGNLDDADEAWLLSKCLFKYSSTKPEMQTREMTDFVHREMLDGNVYTILVPTNKKVQILNDAVLNKIPGNIYQLHAKDVQITRRCATLIENKAVRDKIKALDKDPRLTAGLESSLR